MRTRRTVTEVARNFSEIITRVAERGERVDLVRAGAVVASLVPAPPGVRLRDLPELLDSLPSLAPREAAAWYRDIRAGYRVLKPLRSPWQR